MCFRSAVYAGEDASVSFFNSWHNLIVSTVPKEKLLIYNVKDGWGPIVEFLDMDLPDEPFPDINDGITVTLIVVGGYYILVLVIPTLILVCCWKKSSKFRSTVQRIYGATLRVPIMTLRNWKRSRKTSRNISNSAAKNNNNNLSDKNYDYIQYSNIQSTV